MHAMQKAPLYPSQGCCSNLQPHTLSTLCSVAASLPFAFSPSERLWSPQHALRAGCGDNAVRVFVEEPERGGDPGAAPAFRLAAQRRQAHAGDVNCVRWHPRDDGLLASAGDDGAVRLWRLRPGRGSLDPGTDPADRTAHAREPGDVGGSRGATSNGRCTSSVTSSQASATERSDAGAAQPALGAGQAAGSVQPSGAAPLGDSAGVGATEPPG